MKYPLNNENNIYPEDSICPICKNKRIFEPHNFIVLEGGALFINDSGDSVLNESMKGFLCLLWHGCHNINNDSEIKANLNLEVIKNSKLGQFSLYFCSTKCLRVFLNNLIDDFEDQLSKIKYI